jgi:hypothetical protein
VRDEYSRLYGVRREAHLKLRGDMRPYEAKISTLSGRLKSKRASRHFVLNAMVMASRSLSSMLSRSPAAGELAAAGRDPIFIEKINGSFLIEFLAAVNTRAQATY